MGIHICMFGSTHNYSSKIPRLEKLFTECGIFDSFKIYTEHDLMKDRAFWEQHGEFILNNSRGFGYWIWKPYLYHKFLNTLSNDEYIVLLDCGCDIDISCQKILDYYIEMIKPETGKDMICFQLLNCFNRDFIKMDTLHHFDSTEVGDRLQCQSGLIVSRNTESFRAFLIEWYTKMCHDNYHHIDDSPSIIANPSTFVEHRHDQAIYNCCLHKYDNKVVLPDVSNYRTSFLKVTRMKW